MDLAVSVALSAFDRGKGLTSDHPSSPIPRAFTDSNEPARDPLEQFQPVVRAALAAFEVDTSYAATMAEAHVARHARMAEQIRRAANLQRQKREGSAA
jgi:hypothetical protein